MAEIAMANDDFRNSIIWQICVPNFMLFSTSEIFGWIFDVSRYTTITIWKIKSEQNFKNKISGIAKWTNDQRQSEIKEVQLLQDIVDEKKIDSWKYYLITVKINL